MILNWLLLPIKPLENFHGFMGGGLILLSLILQIYKQTISTVYTLTSIEN